MLYVEYPFNSKMFVMKITKQMRFQKHAEYQLLQRHF